MAFIVFSAYVAPIVATLCMLFFLEGMDRDPWPNVARRSHIAYWGGPGPANDWKFPFGCILIFWPVIAIGYALYFLFMGIAWVFRGLGKLAKS